MSDIQSIADLTPDPSNRRKHNPRNIGMIVESLQKVGAARSIVIDERGNILAGSGTIDAAAEAGIERVQVVDADGETIIAVRRTGLTDEQKRKLALYDNRTAELAEWDTAQIAADLEAGLSFEGVFFENELSATLEKALSTEVYGDTSTERDKQGVSSTWDQVKASDKQKVVIGDIETRVSAEVVEVVERALNAAYEQDRKPIPETLEAILVAGVRAVEASDR